MAVRALALPNFFLVGAPKAGTTSLYHYLDQHPQIYMSPVKEPNYFASEIRLENFGEELRRTAARDLQSLREYLDGPMGEMRFGGIVSEWENYLKLFRNVDGQKAIGEASVCYLWSKTAPGNILARIPHAKILMILRDPAERAFSQYMHGVTFGAVRRSFLKQVRTALRGASGKFEPFSPFLEFGLYHEQVRRYLELFPRENIRIYLFEDYRNQQRQILADIFRFLGVDSSFAPDVSRKHLEPRSPRSIGLSYFLKRTGIWWRVRDLTPSSLRPSLRALVFRKRRSLAMKPEARQILREYYREDTLKLATLLGRDLSAWLR